MKAFSPVPSLFTCFVAITCMPSLHGYSLHGVWNNIKQILFLGTSNQENVAGARPSMAVDDHFGILWGMPDTEAIVGHLFKLPIPSNALKGDVQHYHFRINEAGSTTLPQWLYFNSSSYTFYGLPTPTDQGMVYIELSVQSEHKSLKAEPATMSFFIRVHMPNRAYLSHNLKPVQENTDHMEQSKTARCPWDENSNEATLVLDTTMPEITALERITLLYKAAHFLGHNVNDISLMPKRNSVVAKLLDQQTLVAGPGNVGLSTTNVGVELSWAVGCGEFKQANDITRVMEHNIKNNLITTELGYKIIGWHVSQTQPPENIRKLRKRRQAAAATPTPTVFSSLPTRLTDMSTYTVIASAETTIMEPSPSAPEQTLSSTMSSTMAVQPTLTTGRKSSLLTEVPSISTSMQSLSRDSISDVLTSAFSEIPMASSIHTGPSGTIVATPTLPSMDASSFIPSPTYQSMSTASDQTLFSTTIPALSSPFKDSSMFESKSFYSEMSPSLSSSYDSIELSALHTASIESSLPVIVSTPVFTSSPSVIDSSILSTSYETTLISPTSTVSSMEPSFSVDSSITEILPSVSEPVTVSPSPSTSSLMSSSSSSLTSDTTSDTITSLATESPTPPVSPTVVSSSLLSSVLPSIPVTSTITLTALESSQFPITSSVLPSTFYPTPSLPSDSVISLSSPLLLSTTSLEVSSSSSVDIPSLTVVISSSSNISTTLISSSGSDDLSVTTVTSSSGLSPSLISGSSDIYTPVISSSSEMSTPVISSSSIPETVTSVLTSATSSIVAPITTSSIVAPSFPVTMVSSHTPEVTQLPTSIPTSSPDLSTSIASTPVSSSTTSDRLYTTGEVIGVETLFTALPVSTSLSNIPSVTSTAIVESSRLVTTSTPSITTSSSMSSVTSEIVSTSIYIVSPSSTTSSSITPSSSPSLPPTTTSSAITTPMPPVTTSVVVTTDRMTTSRRTTTKPVAPTTEQLTSAEITTVVPNTAPVILNPVDKIQSILGTYFEFRIPEDTFFDKEDGNTRKLNLTMYFANGSSLVPQSWVQFISKSQTVYGLPLTKDITPLPLEFYIVAEDTGGLKARDAFQILIDVESVNDISYQFIMHFTQDFSTFMLATRNYIEVVSKMGAYYGDANSSLTTVTDISSGSVIMSVTNNTISKVACENETILDLYRRMNSSGQLNLAFVRAMVPFAVEQVHLEWLGVCLVEPSNATVGPTSIPVIGGGTSTGVIIAVILVILVILIIFIILVCIFCRRRRQKGRYLPEDEKPIYGKNRKPVLLEDELELRDKNMRPKRPVVLSKDNDPNTYANEGFSPAEEGLRQAPPSYIVPYDGGYGPTFDALDGPSSPPVYLPSPAATSSPFDQPPPEYKLPPPYLMYPGHSKA